MAISYYMQILGAPYDSSKFHTTANHKSGSCSLWDSNNVMSAKVTLKEVAAIKFSVFSKVERGQGKNSTSLACIQSLRIKPCAVSPFIAYKTYTEATSFILELDICTEKPVFHCSSSPTIADSSCR